MNLPRTGRHDGEQPDENVCQDPANLAFRGRDAPAVFRLALTAFSESNLTACATFGLLARFTLVTSKYILDRAGHDFINTLKLE